MYGKKLAEGKTKIVYTHPSDPELAYLVHKDGITAGDGARRNVIEGKGALAGHTAANVLAYLQRQGIATHFVSAPEDRVTLVKRCAMIPVEVVMRRLATGSYLKRHPETAEGSRFDPVLVEYFIKDDAHHDPQATAEELTEKELASTAEVARMTEVGRQVFAALEQAWAALGVTLVDLKIEFGRAPGGHLLVADVIDNDSWRLWPGGDKNQMLDKQVYRNLPYVTPDDLNNIKGKYAYVSELTDSFAKL